MAVRVSTTTSNVSVRVGQENAVKVLSSSASNSDYAVNAETSLNVIGGIASVSQLNVSGGSTSSFLTVTGISTFGDLSIDGNVEFNNGRVYFPYLEEYGSVLYLGGGFALESTESSSSPQLVESNLILSTNESGLPSWSNTIDGGTY